MDNTAVTYGGGSCDSTLSRCVLSGNEAQFGGGCSELSDDAVEPVNNCLIVGNIATDGAGSYKSDLEHCTVKGNAAAVDGGGCYGGTLINSIVVGNMAAGDGDDLYAMDTVIASCSPILEVGQSGTTNAPRFADALLHLRADSPCIDAAFYQFPPILIDLDGLPRPLDGDNDSGAEAVDMGAYEFAGDGDQDDDGLSDAEEVLLASLLNNDDSDDDGRTDGDEVADGFCPTFNEAAAIAQGEANIIGDPAAHDLYTADSIQDFSLGHTMIPTSNNIARMTLQVEQTTNLTSGGWADVGEPEPWELATDSGVSFVRIHGE
jgi:hypothetical protein